MLIKQLSQSSLAIAFVSSSWNHLRWSSWSFIYVIQHPLFMLVGSFHYLSSFIFIGHRIRCLFQLSSSVTSLGYCRRSTLAITFSIRIVHHLVSDHPPCLICRVFIYRVRLSSSTAMASSLISIKAYIVIASAGGHPVSHSSPRSTIHLLATAHLSPDSSPRPRLCGRLPIRQEVQPRRYQEYMSR